MLEDLAQLRRLAQADPLPADPRHGAGPLATTSLGQLGIELLEVHVDRVIARMPAPGRFDRGALLVLAESAASTAAGTAAGPSRRAFGAELDAAFLDADWAGPVVLAQATPLVVDPARHTWRIEVVDALGTRLLEARCTLGIVDAPA